MRKNNLLVFVLSLGLLGLACATDAHAVQIKKVYRGLVPVNPTNSFDADDTTRTVSLPAAVDQTKTLVLLNWLAAASNNREQSFFFNAQIEGDNQTLSVQREGANVACDVYYYVIEFEDGVDVYRSFTSMDQNVTTKTITVTGKNWSSTKVFPIVNMKIGLTNATNTECATVKASFPSSNQIQLDRLDGGVNKTLNMVYQVVDFQTDARVTAGTAQIATNGSSTTATVSPSIADLAKAFLVTTYTGGTGVGGIEENLWVRGTITDASTVTFNRAAVGTTNDQIDINWYVVELQDSNTLVQRGAGLAVASSSATPGAGQPTFTALTLDRAFPMFSVSGGSGAGTALSDDLDFKAEFTATNTLSFTRGTTTTAASIDWEAVELPPLTVKIPNGGEVWRVCRTGETNRITWKHSADVLGSHLGDIELSVNSGTSYLATKIATGIDLTADAGAVTAGEGSYDWATPASLSSTDLDVATCRIKVTNTSLSARNFDVSNADFTIKGQIQVLTPNTGITLAIDGSYGITWSVDGNLDNNGLVILKLYSASGATYDSHIIPAVNISSSTNASPISVTTAAAHGLSTGHRVYIAGHTVNTNANGTWVVTVTGANTFTLDSSTGNGVGGATGTVARGFLPSAGATGYTWTIPDKVGFAWRVQAELSSDATGVLDQSDADFTIKGSITLTAPNGTPTQEVWPAQTTKTITWNKTGTFSTVTIYLSTNSGGTYPTTIIAGTSAGTTSGSYGWTIPVSAISNFARVKVVSDLPAQTSVEDPSDADFKIVPSLQVTSPNTGNEVWLVGETTRAITWNLNGTISTVKIEYSTNGFSDELQTTTIIASTNADPAPVDGTGTYTWPSIPDAIGDTVKVRVSDTDAPAPPAANARYDVSDNAFKIRGRITVTAPTSAVVDANAWRVHSATIPSTSNIISWTRDGAFGNVDIHYSTTNGSSYPNEIATNYSSGNTYTWTIPAAARSDTVKVRVRATNVAYQTDTLDESDTFHVKGNLDVTYPDGNETLDANVPITITWNNAGLLGGENVKIEYATDGATFNNTVVASTAGDSDPPSGSNNGQYATWTPLTVSTNYKIKITSLSDSYVTATSGTTFSVKGSLTNIAPDALAYWHVGETKNVSWASTPSDQGNVKILWSTNGTDFPYLTNTLATVSSTATPYSFAVGDAQKGENIWWRVERDLDSNVKVTSSTAIKIYKLVSNQPTASEILRIGTAKTIQWTKDTGAFTTPSNEFKVYKSIDGGAYTEITSTPLPTGTTFSYTPVAADRSTNVRFKVEWQGATNINVISPQCSVKPTVNMTSPDGGATVFYGIGDTVPITFTHKGSTSDTWRLLYSTNGGDAGGGTYPYPQNHIIDLTSIAADTPYTHNWTVPNATGILSGTVRVKVELIGDATDVKDESVNTFSIRGSLTAISPNATTYWMVGDVNRSISWTSLPSDQGDVDILWSTDGTNFPNPGQRLARVNSATSPYSFNVADAHKGENITWRLERVLDPTNVRVTAAAPIKIYNLLLDQPVASEILRVGTQKTIQWTKETGAFTTPSNEFKVYKSIDGAGYVEITSSPLPTGTSFNYTPVAGDRSTNVRFKVQWQGATNIEKESGVVWVKPNVTLALNPSSGPYAIDQSLTLTVTHTGNTGPSGDTWKLRYSDDSGAGWDAANVIATSATGEASPWVVNWTVPETSGLGVTLTGNKLKIKAEMVGDETNVKSETGVLVVRGKITLTSAPTSSTVWKVGDAKNITWTSKGLTNVSITYTKNNGVDSYSGTVVASTGAAAGSYNWNPGGTGIPTTVPSDQFRFKVKAIDTADSVTEAISEMFSVVPKLTLSYPTGGQTLLVYALSSVANRTITWTRSGDSRNADDDFVEIYYTKNTTGDTDGDGIPDPPEGTWTGIATGVNAVLSSAGQYTWPSLPNDVTTTARIVLRLKNDSKTKSVPAGYFRIRADVLLDQPTASGITAGANTNYDVKWTPTGTFPGGTTVALEWTTDDFATVVNPVTGPLGESAANLAVGADGVQQSFTWRTPNQVFSTGKVRVRVNGDTIESKSLNTFTLIGSLTGISPNATAYWMKDENRSISWTSSPADQGDVDILWSFDGTNFPNPAQRLARVNSGSSPYAFTVGDAHKGENVTWRVERVADPGNTRVTAAAPIKIYNLVLDQPVASEILRVGTAKTIQWTKESGAFTTPANTFAVFKSIDGAGYVEVTDPGNRPTGTSFNYAPVAGDRSTNVRFKVQWQGSTNVERISGVVSVKPNVTLALNPSSGPYAIDQSLTLTVTHTGNTGPSGDTWKLRYSDDSGAGWDAANVIATSATGEASPWVVNWTVPETSGLGVTLTGNKLVVKAEMVGDETNVKSQTGVLVVRGKITLTSAPTSSTVWRVGDSRNITWTSKGLTNVSISYTKNNGVDSYAGTIVGSTGAAAGSYTWNPAGPPTGIPTNATTDQFRFRVKAIDAADSATEAISEMFSVVPKLTLTYPTGGQTLRVYALESIANRTITWTRSGDDRNADDSYVEVYYTKDTTGDLNGDGIPDPPEGTWTGIATGASAVLSSALQYTWPSLPNDVTTTARIVLRLRNDSKTKSVPAGYFRIRADVLLDQPTANGISLSALSDYSIKWTPTGTFPGGTTVALEWTTDDFGTITDPVIGPPPGNAAANDLPVGADGIQQSFTWRVPAQITSTGKVRVRVNGDTIISKSLNTFSIVGSLTNIAPNTTEYWMKGETRNISWTSTPADQGDVNIVWSFDGTNFPEPGQRLATVNSQLTPQSFTVDTQHLGENVTWRVYRVADPNNVRVTSAAPVKIYNLVLDQPTPSEILRIGTAKTIQWTKHTGAYTTPSNEFKVYKSIDGAGFTEITSSPLPTGTSFSYTPVDADRSNNVKFRVEWQGATNVRIDSAQVYIKPKADLTSPDSGTFAVDGSVPITFSHTGRTGPSGDTWDIYYSTNGGDAGGGTYPAGNKIHTTATGVASPYTFNWTVPDTNGIVGNNVRFKVEMVGDANVKDESLNTVTIRGKIVLTYPNATSVVWKVGDTTRTITWTSKQLTNVRIDYTKNNGTDNYGNVITTSTSAAAGSYTWNPSGPPAGIPTSAPSDQFRVRVKAIDAADSATEAISEMFTVVPKLTLTYPTGGETLLVYGLSSVAARTITWTKSGDSRNSDDDYVDVYYTKNTTGDTDGDGMPDPPEGSWTSIASGASAVLASANQYTWPSVPNDASTTARIVLRLKNDSRTKDIKNTYFRIRADVRLDTPGETSGQAYGVGTDKVIRWTPTGTFPGGTTVALEWSTDNFVSVVNGCTGPPPGNASGADLAVGADGVQQSFTWRIPNGTSTTVKVRVRVNGDTIEHKCANNFAITGSLFVDAPDGPQHAWVPGDAESIQWRQLGGISLIDIYFSRNNGADGYPVTVAADVAAGPESGSSLPWPGGVPNEPTADTYKIKIVDSDNTSITDVSTNPFIIKSRISGVSPGGSSAEYVGDPLTISWSETGQPGPVTIELSKNGFSDETQNVSLTSSYTHGAQVQYVVPGGVPDALSETVKYRVKSEQSNANLVASGMSASNHPIRGKITINAQPAKTLGDDCTVSWSRSGSIGNVKVEYFDGSSWSTLTNTAPEAGPYTFNLSSPTVSETATDLAQVRVSDADRPEVVSTSTAFLVKPYINITSPVNNTVFTCDTTPAITWQKKGSNVLNVKIEYSKDNFATAPTVLYASTSNDESENWPAPGVPSADVSPLFNKSIRIKTLPEASPWAVTVAQNGFFKIVGTVTLTSPVGTDKWSAGTTRNVKWNYTGNIQNVRLVYTTDNWNTTGTIVDSTGASGGSTGYPWPIPTTAVTNAAIVRIYDQADTSVYDDSEAGFKIVPGFTFTSPTSSSPATGVYVKQPFTVTWNRLGTGTPNTINLEWSNDNGFSWNTIENGVTNSGTYSWTDVPDMTGLPDAEGKLRIVWTGDTTVTAESEPFTFRTKITVVAPNDNTTKWDVGAFTDVGYNRVIRWTSSSANVANVAIDYSLDGGNSYPFQVISSTSNAGAANAERTFTWDPIPTGSISDQFKVRVTATNDASAVDSSDFNGKLKMFVKVLTPNAANLEMLKGGTYNITWSTVGAGPTSTDVKLAYSRNNFNTFTPIMDGVLDYTPNDGFFQWTIPDDIGNAFDVKVRVISRTDLDAFDVSDNGFKIRGDYTVSAPVNSQGFKIYHATQNPNTENITWTTTGGAGGTMGTVNLIAYTTNPIDPNFRDGSNNVHTLANPLTIVSGLTNNPNASTTYPWQVPDKASTTIIVRVINPNDATIYKDSPTFKIQGSVTVTYPNATNITFTVGTPVNLTWNKTGSSIARVKITISKNGLSGPWLPITENEEGTANDGIVTNDGELTGYIVDDFISPDCILKIEDPLDATVTDVSDNTFRIRGGLTWNYPLGGERFIVNKPETLQWTTTGTIAQTDLLYTTDNFTASTVVFDNRANSLGANSYSWTVPNTLSPTVKLRIADSADDQFVYTDSLEFRIELYNVTFNIQDVDSNANISGLTATGTNTTTPSYTWPPPASPINSPLVKGLPYGVWTGEFNDTNGYYAKKGWTVDVNADKTITVQMNELIPTQREAVTELVYNANTDSASLTSFLLVKSRGANAQFCEVKIYDGATLIKTFTKNGAPDVGDPAFTYFFTWNAPTGLLSTKAYTIVTTMQTTLGANVTTPRTFNTAVQADIKALKDTVNTKLDTNLSQVKTDVENILNLKLGEQKTLLEGTKSELIAKQNEMKASLASSLVSLDDKAKLVEAAGQQVKKEAVGIKATNLEFAPVLGMPDEVVIGSKNVVIAYQAPVPGLTPLVTITTKDSAGKDVSITKNVPMIPNASNTKRYEYVIQEISSAKGFTIGKSVEVLVTCDSVFSDPLYDAGKPVQNVEFDSFQVVDEKSPPGESGVKSLVQNMQNQLKAVQSTLTTGAFPAALEGLKFKMDDLYRATTKSGQDSEMKKALNLVRDQLKTLGGDKGYDLSKIVGEALSKDARLGKISETTGRMQGTVDLIGKIMESEYGDPDHKPIIHLIVQ